MKAKLLKIREDLVRANEMSRCTYNVDIYDGDIIYRRAGGALDSTIALVDELIEEIDEDRKRRRESR